MKSLSRSVAFFITAVVASSAQDAKLLKQFSAAERSERREAAVEIQKLGAGAKVYLPQLIKALSDPDKQVWSSAIATIAAIGPDAAEAIPALIKDMDGKKTRGKRTADLRQAVYRNAFALGRIGPTAVPPLIEALRSEDMMTRQGAAKALEYIGEKAKDAIPALLENIAHPHAELRVDVINALSVVALQSSGEIVSMLDSGNPLEREGALRVLGKMGKSGASASGRLLEMSTSEREPAIRAVLLETLVAIRADQERVFPLLLEGIKDTNPTVLHAAVNGVLTVDSDGRRALPEVMTLLQNDDVNIRRYAAHLAGCYGEAAEQAVPVLLAIVLKEPADSQFAIDALAKIGAPAAREILKKVGSDESAQITKEHWAAGCIERMGAVAVPELIKGMESKEVSIRLLAVLGCAALRIEAAPAMDALKQCSADPDARVRAAAFVALPAVEMDVESLLPLIELALKDPDASVQISALAQVPYLKGAGEPLASSLLVLMNDDSVELRKAAVRAISSNMNEAIPPLVKSLDDAKLRDDAIESLGRFGARAQPAISKLVEILPGSKKETRRRIIATLALTGSADAVAPLAAALKDEDAGCRAAAVGAYLKVERDAEAKFTAAMSMLQDGEINVRRSAAEAIPLLGERAQEATQPLVKMLQTDTDRGFVVETLRRISIKSIPDLIEILGNPNEAARLFAVQRLGQIGITAADAAPALKTLSQDNQQPENIRGEAMHALRRMGR